MTREEAIRDIEECVLPYVGGISLRMAIEDMKEMDRLSKAVPVLKEPERKHGEWKKKPRYEDAEYPDEQPDLECPFCGYSIGWWDLGYYCAKCGARLIGSAVDDDARVEGEEK